MDLSASSSFLLFSLGAPLSALLIINLIIKAVALAMGVAVVVLSVLNKLSVESGMVLLGIGMTCTGISLFNSQRVMYL